MTLEEIIKLADERFAILKKDCRLERIRKEAQKQIFIERLKKEHGISE